MAPAMNHIQSTNSSSPVNRFPYNPSSDRCVWRTSGERGQPKTNMNVRVKKHAGHQIARQGTAAVFFALLPLGDGASWKYVRRDAHSTVFRNLSPLHGTSFNANEKKAEWFVVGRRFDDVRTASKMRTGSFSKLVECLYRRPEQSVVDRQWIKR